MKLLKLLLTVIVKHPVLLTSEMAVLGYHLADAVSTDVMKN